jgi:hypothetical protein
MDPSNKEPKSKMQSYFKKAFSLKKPKDVDLGAMLNKFKSKSRINKKKE